MKVLNKRQAIILIILNAAAVIMAAILIFGGLVRGGSTPADGASPEPWNTQRAPRSSLNEHVVWETNIGGSGDDTVLAAYRVGSTLHVIGNTLSDDFDFASDKDERGFLATLASNGAIQAIQTFDAVSSVTLHERGYVMTLKNETGVILVSYDGEVLKRTSFGGVFPETTVDLKMLGNGYAVVVSVETQTEKTELKVYRLDGELNVVQTTSLSRSGSLKYLDLYEKKSELLLVANFVSDVINCLTFIEVKGTPVYHEVTTEFSYKALAVSPSGNGFIALVVDRDTGFGNLLEISSDYVKKSLRYLNAANPASGKLIATADHTYAYFHLGADVSTLAVFDYKLDYINVASDASTLTALDAFYINGSTVTFVGRTDTGVQVFSADGIATRNVFSIDAPASDLRCVKSTSGIVLVGNAYGTAADCGANQGGADVWVASVR